MNDLNKNEIIQLSLYIRNNLENDVSCADLEKVITEWFNKEHLDKKIFNYYNSILNSDFNKVHNGPEVELLSKAETIKNFGITIKELDTIINKYKYIKPQI